MSSSLLPPLNLCIKKLSPHATIPKRATEGSAGFDLYAIEDGTIPSNTRKLIPLGFATSFSADYYMQITDRSGLAFKNTLSVEAGVIDSSFRGDWKLLIHNHGNSDFTYKTGDRIAQTIPLLISQDEPMEVDILDDTKRGQGGFGSTGISSSLSSVDLSLIKQNNEPIPILHRDEIFSPRPYYIKKGL